MSTRKWEPLDFDMPACVDEFLRKLDLNDTPVDVFELCRRAAIIMLPYSTQKTKDVLRIIEAETLASKTDGFTLQIKKHPIIFWDDRKSTTCQHIVVAHEIAHNVLEHTGKWQYGSSKKPDCFRCPNNCNCIEWQADSFATYLLSHKSIYIPKGECT